MVVLKRPNEKVRAKNEKLFFVLVDLEKVVDWVPRGLIYFTLRQ